VIGLDLEKNPILLASELSRHLEQHPVEETLLVNAETAPTGNVLKELCHDVGDN